MSHNKYTKPLSPKILEDDYIDLEISSQSLDISGNQQLNPKNEPPGFIYKPMKTGVHNIDFDSEEVYAIENNPDWSKRVKDMSKPFLRWTAMNKNQMLTNINTYMNFLKIREVFMDKKDLKKAGNAFQVTLNADNVRLVREYIQDQFQFNFESHCLFFIRNKLHLMVSECNRFTIMGPKKFESERNFFGPLDEELEGQNRRLKNLKIQEGRLRQELNLREGLTRESEIKKLLNWNSMLELVASTRVKRHISTIRERITEYIPENELKAATRAEDPNAERDSSNDLREGDALLKSIDSLARELERATYERGKWVPDDPEELRELMIKTIRDQKDRAKKVMGDLLKRYLEFYQKMEDINYIDKVRALQERVIMIQFFRFPYVQ